jgi:hypothetical protein
MRLLYVTSLTIVVLIFGSTIGAQVPAEEFNRGLAAAARTLAETGKVLVLPDKEKFNVSVDLKKEDIVVETAGNNSRLALTQLPKFIQPYRRLLISTNVNFDNNAPVILVPTGLLLDEQFQPKGFINDTSYSPFCSSSGTRCSINRALLIDDRQKDSRYILWLTIGDAVGQGVPFNLFVRNKRPIRRAHGTFTINSKIADQ